MEKKAKCHHEGRFQASWLVDFPWVEHEEQKLFCRICKEAEVKSVSKSKVQNSFRHWQREKSALSRHEAAKDHRNKKKKKVETE